MPVPVAEDYLVVVHPVVAPGARRRRWCASARISGHRDDGAPFTMVLDLYGESFGTEDEALRYGALKAEARMQRLIERGGRR